MSEEMIERVARAMFESLHGRNHVGHSWGTRVAEAQETYRQMARAAIAAMREPTEAMIDAIADAKMDFDEPTADDCIAVWQAGIGAALNSDVKPA